MHNNRSRFYSQAFASDSIHNSLDTNSQHNKGEAEFASEWRRICGLVSGPRRCACRLCGVNLERCKRWTVVILVLSFRPLSNIVIWACNWVCRLELMMETHLNDYPQPFPPLRRILSSNQFPPHAFWVTITPKNKFSSICFFFEFWSIVATLPLLGKPHAIFFSRWNLEWCLFGESRRVTFENYFTLQN